MAREIEERDVHPEMYEQPKPKKPPGFSTRYADHRTAPGEHTYPWQTRGAAGGYIPSWTTTASAPREMFVVPRLVGGPCAGVRHHDQDGARPVVLATEPMPLHDPLGHGIDSDTIQQYEYTRCNFTCGRMDFLAYVFRNAFEREEDVLRELFSGYNPRR